MGRGSFRRPPAFTPPLLEADEAESLQDLRVRMVRAASRLVR